MSLREATMLEARKVIAELDGHPGLVAAFMDGSGSVTVHSAGTRYAEKMLSDSPGSHVGTYAPGATECEIMRDIGKLIARGRLGR